MQRFVRKSFLWTTQVVLLLVMIYGGLWGLFVEPVELVKRRLFGYQVTTDMMLTVIAICALTLLVESVCFVFAQKITPLATEVGL